MSWREAINSLLGKAGYAITRFENVQKLARIQAIEEAAVVAATEEGGASRLLVKSGRSRQDVAIERYLAGSLRLPDQFFPFEKALMVSPEDVARALTLGVMYINTADVKGDVIEFGTMSGYSARIIANAMMYDLQRQPSYPFRKLHLYDSFKGLPDFTSAIDQDSVHVQSGAWSPGGCKVLSLDGLWEVVTEILPAERIDIVPGWFADTVGKLPDTSRFAMIHFDGDLYQSMIDALTPCFERGFVSRGAVLCCDDWNCNQADPAFGERRAWAELVEKFHIEFTFSGCYGETGAKLIVHNYRGMPEDKAPQS